MRILISNDDGIDAPGIVFLAAAAAALSNDIWIVAPERKWTAASHQLSFDCDLTLTRKSHQTYASSGSPADGVVAAMAVLFKDDTKPDLVISGVNDGRNAGEDAAYSGTLAIAREATFWGIPGIGFSRTKDGAMGAPEVAALAALLKNLWRTKDSWLRDGHWLSVNLPKALPAPVAAARIGRDKIARQADVISTDRDKTVWRIKRGRPHTSTTGDENTLIDAGTIAIGRHGWIGFDPVEEAVIKACQPV
jgi:5'-nucleotidase